MSAPLIGTVNPAISRKNYDIVMANRLGYIVRVSISLKYRQCVPDMRRLVVKIGSRVLVQKSGRPDLRRMRALVDDIARIRNSGREVIVVSSGAIAMGMETLKMKARPTELPDLQMAAAVGQTRLMSRYSELFAKRGCRVGQILLTHADFQQKSRQVNAGRTIENLLQSGIIPIINENDVVADEEIRADQSLGDNDNLASLVVHLVRADLLVMLTTVDGVRETGKAGRTRRVHYIEKVTQETLRLASDKKSRLSRGGMGTKLKAAQAAARSGAAAVIANGRATGVLSRIMRGEDVGTLILAS
jgi:glutamate 5-kinase